MELKRRRRTRPVARLMGADSTAARGIGPLERALLYGLVRQGQHGAIGCILVAKAFPRFREWANHTFAEYVLIGTLLSACLALLIGATIKWPLPA